MRIRVLFAFSIAVVAGEAHGQALAKAHQVSAAMEVSVTVVRACAVSANTAREPGCEAVVREGIWVQGRAAGSAPRPHESSREPPAGTQAPRIVVRTIDY